MKTLKFLVVAVLALSIVACSADIAQGQKIDETTDETSSRSTNEVKIEPVLIGKGEITNFKDFTPPNRLITSVKEWNELKTALRGRVYGLSTFDETDIDFSAYQAIALFDEIQRSGGWSIDITGIVEDSEKITVSITHLKKGNLTAVLTQPYHIVRIPASFKKIIFEFQ
jgi:hypothetical protein